MQQAVWTMSEIIEITRYPNRRLYDRSQKQYVTLGDIESIVLEGKSVRVLDSKSGEDLTRMILTQIILERHPERMHMFPVAFLHEILRADKLVLDWLAVYFGQALKLMEGVSRRPTLPLLPGLDFWRALFVNSPPAASPESKATNSASSPSVSGGQASSETLNVTAISELPADPEGNPSLELVTRILELERRLAQLEQTGESTRNGTEPAVGDDDRV
jgi:polyhydroxyalkanoate synthesis repressor PhaR